MKWHAETIGHCYDPGEGLVVYYDPASGDTHLISEFATSLVGLLSAQPLDLEEIKYQIASDIDPDDLPALAASLPEVLDRLLDLEIIQAR